MCRFDKHFILKKMLAKRPPAYVNVDAAYGVETLEVEGIDIYWENGEVDNVTFEMGRIVVRKIGYVGTE